MSRVCLAGLLLRIVLVGLGHVSLVHSIFTNHRNSGLRGSETLTTADATAQDAKVENHDTHADLGNRIYVAMTHHKAGSWMLRHMFEDMKDVIGVPFTNNKFISESIDDRCQSPHAVFVQASTVPGVRHVLSRCPNVRAVQIIRRPWDMVISNYLYSKNLAGPERFFDMSMHFPFLLHDVDWGIQHTCQAYLDNATSSDYPGPELSNMLSMHQLIEAKSEPFENVLEVRLEDFASNFDDMARRIFEHWLGKGDPRIGLLSKMAIKHDIARTPPSQPLHESDPQAKGEAKAVMKRLFEEGDPCVRGIVERGRQLGYDYDPTS